jgi:rRNA-processing protein FCF1
MNLGSYSVGFPVFELESSVTFQTVRSPTVFERMVMKLCHRYRDEPAIAGMTFQEVFEDVFGVAAAAELVGPCIENLMFMGVITRPSGNDIMSARIQDVLLTTDGVAFLDRDRLPGRSKQTTVKHIYLPLLRTVKLNKGNHGHKEYIDLPRVSSTAFQPTDSSLLVRNALMNEKHAWKSANTEIHAIESTIVGTIWESQKIDISIDDSGALSISGAGSKEFQKWLEMADSNLVWQEILNPILNSTGTEIQKQLDESVLRFADSITAIDDGRPDSLSGFRPAKAALVVVRSIENVKDLNGVPAIVLNQFCTSASRIEAESGGLIVEVPYPATFAKGFSWFQLSRSDLTPSASITGVAPLSWGGQVRSGCLRIRLRHDASDQIWSVLRTSLEACLSGSDDSGLMAFAALWEQPEKTILKWMAKTEQLAIDELIGDAEIFLPALEQFSVKGQTDWKGRWQASLSDAIVSACHRIKSQVGIEELVQRTKSILGLLSDRSSQAISSLLVHAEPFDDEESLKIFRQAAGTGITIPLALLSSRLVEGWISDALSSSKVAFHGPHEIEPAISSLSTAYQRIVRDIGLASLDDAIRGTLNLKYVKATALDGAFMWISAYQDLEELLKAAQRADNQIAFDINRKVIAWRDLACKHLAPPNQTDHRLIVLDTSAVMVAPDLVTRMRSRDLPVIPRRVLEELDGLKESNDEQKAQSARAAIRAIEAAGNRIRYESEVLELLPPDWDHSPDNKILSVAMYLRLSEVLLVTGDINFRNKARAEEIRAQTPDEYQGLNQGNKPTGNGNKKKGKK